MDDNDRTVLKIALLAAIGGLGGGFLWGVGDHRGSAALDSFISSHVALDERQDGTLAMTCSKGGPSVMAYDLRTDTIVSKQQEIDRLKTIPLNEALNNDFISHTMAVATGAYTGIFSVARQVEVFVKGEKGLLSDRVLLVTVGVLVPTAGLGYLASGWLKLECSSNSIYSVLAEKKAWTRPRREAARKIFNEFEFCFDRSRTVLDGKDGKVANEPLVNWLKDHRAAIAEWRQFIAPANTDLPNQSVVASRFDGEPLLLSAANEQMPDVTWGDSVFQRIYGGANGWTTTEQGFDATDFKAMFAARDRCAQLDVGKAKELYLNARPPADLYRTLDARRGPLDRPPETSARPPSDLYGDARLGPLDRPPETSPSTD